MCGRFTQTRTWSELADLYRLADAAPPATLRPRYNIAPTQDIAVLRRAGGGGRELTAMRWGLVPSWAKDIDIGARMINARAETVHEKPAFRDAFRRRRCLIVTDGFYEWQKRPRGPKRPYFLTVADGRPFAFAGLWEAWTPPGGAPLESCAIITTEATAELRPIHDRMPVILTPEVFDRWLDPALAPDEARARLAPFNGALAITPVGTRVNNVRNDDPACVESRLPT